MAARSGGPFRRVKAKYRSLPGSVQETILFLWYCSRLKSDSVCMKFPTASVLKEDDLHPKKAAPLVRAVESHVVTEDAKRDGPGDGMNELWG